MLYQTPAPERQRFFETWPPTPTPEGISPRAREIHDQDGPTAWEIQARVLLGQTDEEIADRLDLPVPAVSEYIASCFDVRDGLKHQDLVRIRIVYGMIREGEELAERDIWRFVAWFIGPAALDIVVDYHYDRIAPDNTFAKKYASILRALAVKYFVYPRCQAFADAVREIRRYFRHRSSPDARAIVFHCGVTLVTHGWNPRGKGRLNTKQQQAAMNRLTHAYRAGVESNVSAAGPEDVLDAELYGYVKKVTENHDVETHRVA